MRPAARVLWMLVVALAATAYTHARQQQQQTPVFRTGTDTVAIYATVLDRYGEMVLNLTKDDFIVFDDEKEQELTVFVNGLQPITATLLLDASASMTLNLDLAKAAAEGFIIRMLPGDQARFGIFSDRVDLSERFTADRDELLATMREKFRIGNPTMLWDAVDQTMTELAPLGGRRVIMLLTDGIDTLSKARAIDILTRAKSDELMIYAVQFRSTARAILAEQPLSTTPGRTFSDDRTRNPPPTESLRRLATQTGGGHFVLGQYDDVNTTFTRVMQELHYQYVLGFTPQRFDGKVHNLTVRLRKQGTYTVRSRQNYMATSRTAAKQP